MFYCKLLALSAGAFLITLTTTVEGGCITMTGSTACPEFGGYSVDLSNSILRNKYPNLDSVDNFLNGNSVIEDLVPACSEWSDRKQQLRFAKTLRCIALIANSGSCNQNKNVAICRGSCNLFTKSYEDVGKQMCPGNATGVEKQAGNWRKFCDSTPVNSCISGERNEAQGCGKCPIAVGKVLRWCGVNVALFRVYYGEGTVRLL
jgi:hypothetical protein